MLRRILCDLLLLILLCIPMDAVSQSQSQVEANKKMEDVLFWAQSVRIKAVDYETISPVKPIKINTEIRGGVPYLVINNYVEKLLFRITNVQKSSTFINGRTRQYRCLDSRGWPVIVDVMVQTRKNKSVVYGEMSLFNHKHVTTYFSRTQVRSDTKFAQPWGGGEPRIAPEITP